MKRILSLASLALAALTISGCLGTTSTLNETIATAKQEAVSEANAYTSDALDSVSEQIAGNLENLATATSAAHARAEAAEKAAHARAEAAEKSAKSYTDDEIKKVRKEIAEKDAERGSRYSNPKDTTTEEEGTGSRFSPEEPNAKIFVGEGALVGSVLHREHVSIKNAKNPLVSLNQNDARINGLDGMLGLDGKDIKSIHIGEKGTAFSIRHAAVFGLKGAKNPLVSYNQKGAKISKRIALAQAWHNAKSKFVGKDGKVFVLENKQKVDVTGSKNPIVTIKDLDVSPSDD